MSLDVYIYLNPKNWKGFIPKLVKYNNTYFNLDWGYFTFIIIWVRGGLHLACTLYKK